MKKRKKTKNIKKYSINDELQKIESLKKSWIESGDDVHLQKAIKLYNKIIRSDTDNIELRINKADLLFEKWDKSVSKDSEDILSSIRIYKKVIDLDPDLTNVYKKLADASIKLCNYDKEYSHSEDAINNCKELLIQLKVIKNPLPVSTDEYLKFKKSDDYKIYQESQEYKIYQQSINEYEKYSKKVLELEQRKKGIFASDDKSTEESNESHNSNSIGFFNMFNSMDKYEEIYQHEYRDNTFLGEGWYINYMD